MPQQRPVAIAHRHGASTGGVQPGDHVLLLPTLLGSLAVTVVGLLYNNAFRDSRYPKYW